MKKNIFIVLGVVVLGSVLFFFFGRNTQPKTVFPLLTPEGHFDAKNATFTIDGTPVMLINGISSIPALPGSATNVVTQYFGNEATGDLSGDGRPDIAFLVMQNNGGSGTFFYVVVALQTKDGGYTTTNAYLIGDRVAPQPTVIDPKTKELVVNYATRSSRDPMTHAPAIGTSLRLVVTKDGVLQKAKE